MKTTPIQDVQGEGLRSPLAGREVTVRGVVSGASRKGFFVQDPDVPPEGERADGAALPPGGRSCGLFVFERSRRPPTGALVEVRGRVADYRADDDERPTTQLLERETRVLRESSPPLRPVWLTAERVIVRPDELARRLNALEGMLVGIEAGSTFVAPSNPFGDYVLVPRGSGLARTRAGGVLIDSEVPNRWLPSLRVLDEAAAPRVPVGAELLSAITGPLNFRSSSYQLAVRDPLSVRGVEVEERPTDLVGDGGAMTVLTLNGFNLDAQVEDPSRVNDPGRDVDDDVGDGRFRRLARAVVEAARCPDVVALQEIQDGDGAELGDVVSGERTLARTCRAIRNAGGPEYRWAEIAPRPGADGGQPGGNIRNAFLYRPDRAELLDGSLRRLGEDDPVFEGSRKPLSGRFRLAGSRADLEVVNVHFASKRHQRGWFAPERPGFDPRLDLRVAQAEAVARHLHALRREGVAHLVTGDFNDFEFSDTLAVFRGDTAVNLTDEVPAEARYDYNHRGVSQALMHGVVERQHAARGRARHDILHVNALRGVKPGGFGEKPTDHAYVVARLELPA